MSMTVGELRKLLEEYDDDENVVLALPDEPICPWNCHDIQSVRLGGGEYDDAVVAIIPSKLTVKKQTDSKLKQQGQ